MLDDFNMYDPFRKTFHFVPKMFGNIHFHKYLCNLKQNK
jgi:hypothetical protein